MLISEAWGDDMRGRIEWNCGLLKVLEVESSQRKYTRLVAAFSSSALVMIPMPFGSDGTEEHFQLPPGKDGGKNGSC